MTSPQWLWRTEGVIDFRSDDAAGDPDALAVPNLIDAFGLLDKGYDYVALGDWHGVLQLGDRIWYSGAPEATRFKERDPGFGLVVDIAAPGAKPVVERGGSGHNVAAPPRRDSCRERCRCAGGVVCVSGATELNGG